MSNNTEAWYRRLFPTSHRIFLNKMINEIATEVTGEVLVIGAGFGRYKSLLQNSTTSSGPNGLRTFRCDFFSLPFMA